MAPQTIVLVPAPTANGDLHIGHLAGPFMAADVYARFRRAAGDDVLFATGVQESQTFVLSTARRQGVDPDELAARSAPQVRSTLAAMGISIDGFAPGDERFQTTLLGIMTRLHEAGAFELRTMTFPYSERRGEYLMEAYVSGTCPVCLAGSCGGVCESCGHHSNPGELLDPRSTAEPDEELTTRDADVLVLPLEPYRQRLIEYYDAPGRIARPHMRQGLAEMLAGPLPDFPITFPSGWGVPSPFAETPGQIINPAIEAFPAGIHSAGIAAEATGRTPSADDEQWLTERGARVAYFMGFDNTHPFALVGVALLFACADRYVVPTMITNEFYELDHDKFSTSRGHVVWGRDLVTEYPRDAIRFFLAATSPEHHRTNFSRSALVTVAETRLVEPWNRLAGSVDGWLDRHEADAGRKLPVTAAGRGAAAAILNRFAAAYDLGCYSLNRAAETIAAQLDRLARRAAALDAADAPADTMGDLFHEVDVFVRAAAPVLTDLADAVLGGSAPHAVTGLDAVTMTPAVRLPRLASVASGGSGREH
jgi:methionyl-tRNA synthetase